MIKHNGFRRVLSVMLTLVLLCSLVAVAGVPVSAAATEYHYTFDDATDGFNYPDYYRDNGSKYNNCVVSGISTKLVSGGYNGSSSAIEMAYTANKSSNGTQHLAAFSFPNNTGSTKNGRTAGQTIHLEAGYTFRITVTYKVTGYTTPAGLYFAMDMGAIGADIKAFSSIYPTKLADITATGGWQTASAIITAVVTPPAKTSAHLVLKMDDNSNRAGTAVQVGAVDIVPVTASTVTFDTNGGGDVAPVSGESGSAIPYPADPTRAGYEFVGWFTADNQAAPANFPSSNITLIAKWLDRSVWGFEGESVGDQLALTNTTGNTATVTTEYAYNGTQSLKLNAANKTGVNRPQVTIKDVNGDTVTIQEGGDYDISFYVMFPDAASAAFVLYWLTAADDDVAYTDSTTRNGEMLYEPASPIPLVGDGVWQLVTVSLSNVQHSGDLRLGIAGNVGGTHTFYIDDVKVVEKVYTQPETGVWSFEDETDDSKISVTLIPDFNNTDTIHVTDDVYHDGHQAARINASQNSGTNRAQMMVKDDSGNKVAIEQGKSYMVSFWLMVPQGEENYNINYWLAATPNDKTFNSTDYKKDDYQLMDATIAPTTLGAWQRVTAYIDAARLDGDLRIGLTRASSGSFSSKFYVDDIKVEEIVYTDPETGVWSFENEATDSKISVTLIPDYNNTDTIHITNEAYYTGRKAARVNASQNSGTNRAQMMVKDTAGNKVAIEQGTSYEVSFWLMVPQGEESYNINYWLAATPNDKTFNSTDYKKDDYQLMEATVTPTALGEWQKVTATIDAARLAGDLRIGLTRATGGRTFSSKFYIDDIKVVQKQKPAGTPPEEGVWSFEDETAGSKISVTLIPEYNNTDTIHVSNEAYHSGCASARINSSQKSGTHRAQMMVKDVAGNRVAIAQGKSYMVSFWLMVPQGEENYTINYWLAATPNDKTFNSTDYKKDDYQLMDATVAPAALGEWQRVTAYIDAAHIGGDLRIGLTRASSGTFSSKFYVDDIKVEEITESIHEPQSFENYAPGTVLDLNTDSSNTIVVSNAIAGVTGTQTALVNSNNGTGNGRPQMMVKDSLGRQLRVYKGRNYEFSFYVYIPQDAADYKFNYWIAAAENENVFSGSNKKDDYVIAEVTADTQPTRGEWVKMTLTVSNCLYNGKLRLGVSGNTSTPHSFYIDELALTEVKADPVGDGDSFENYTLGQTVSLGDASVTVSDEDSHTGNQSAKVVTTGNAIDGAPQFIVNDAYLRPATLEAGKGYAVSFYVVVPVSQADYDIQYWLAVTNGNEPFSASSPRTGVLVDTTTVRVERKNVWQLVSINIPNLTTGGKLRLGISGSTAAAHTFYIDDILVRERTIKTPDPDAMNFENLAVGQHINLKGNSANNMVVVTDYESYTGTQSVQLVTNDKTGDNRPQFNVTDADGNYIRVKKGEDYYLTFMVFVPTNYEYSNISYWAAAVPEDKAAAPFVRGSSFLKNDYVIAEVTNGDLPTPGVWQQIKLAIAGCAYDGILRIGITHSSDIVDYMYIDDIKLEPPQYVLIKFNTNGGEEMDDILLLSDSLIPNDVAPYRQGYEFMGWYTDPACGKDSYFDIYADRVVGRTGDVLTLYAAWREWDDDFKLIVRDEVKKEYKTEYYTEQVWVGDQNLPDPFVSGERPPRAEAEPIVVTPQDEVPPEPSSGIPPWIIVVIIVAAVVVVGGGAAVAAILIKKNKKA